jgi:hypothetical protein
VLRTRLILVILMSIFFNRPRESIVNPYYFSILLSIDAARYLLRVIRILL